MKLKYIFITLLTIGLLSNCKSKKKAVSKSKKEQVVINHNSSKTTIKHIKVSNTPITNSTIKYIDTYKNTAMESMRKYKIPASITLAQGILESSSGNSELTRKSNNHFGIKCHKGWKGKRVYHDDDKKDDCFRVYKDPINSFKDHSQFLTGRTRYAKLFKFKKGDYVSWAKGLSEAGYATDRRYPAKLIALIEKYDLHKYDTEVLGKSYEIPVEKNIKNHIVLKGDTLYSISKKYGLTVEELKRLNDLNSNEISIGQSLHLIK
ncbi:MAG: glucosaminidase domain-containing protein [Lutibacter sp.]|uniref:glucosaminidase domain-containing protein n=1 Tax=Lutibacter sp. TaxID=1925666 RepID=UPI00385EC10D